LALRIAKAGIELDHFWSRLGHHDPDIEHALIRHPLFRHAGQQRLDNQGLNQLHDPRRHHRRRRIRAHAARIQANIAITNPLVVLRRRQIDRAIAIGQHEDRGLFALHELFDDDFR